MFRLKHRMCHDNDCPCHTPPSDASSWDFIGETGGRFIFKKAHDVLYIPKRDLVKTLEEATALAITQERERIAGEVKNFAIGKMHDECMNGLHEMCDRCLAVEYGNKLLHKVLALLQEPTGEKNFCTSGRLDCTIEGAHEHS